MILYGAGGDRTISKDGAQVFLNDRVIVRIRMMLAGTGIV